MIQGKDQAMKRPNLLFLFTDEQRADTLACYGNTTIQMPNLNRLADNACVFEDAYVGQPVCTPSRATIMTGLYPHSHRCVTNNLPLDDEIPCLNRLLPKNTYRSGYFGKWHLGDEIFRQHGFDEWVSIEDCYIPHYSEGRDREARSDYHHFLVGKGKSPANGHTFRRGETAAYPEHLSKPKFLADEACRFLDENRDNPFVLYVNFLEPHMPFTGPRDGQYDPAEVPLPANYEAAPTAAQSTRARSAHEQFRTHGHGGFPLATEQDWREEIARYWGLCSLVDTHAGRIIDKLEQLGLYDDTIIVYTSDHGDMMGSHQLLAKCFVFEECTRVPMLLKLPGQREQQRIKQPMSQVDVVPTLLDVMGLDAPNHLQGQSLRPEIEAGVCTRDVVVEWNPHNADGDRSMANANVSWRAIVTADGWKLCLHSAGEHQLYDLNKDPLETTNLYGSREQQERVNDLTQRLLAWQERTSDTADIQAPVESLTP